MPATLDSERAAVVVVDMQNGFCAPDGALYAPGSEAVIEPVVDLVEGSWEAELVDELDVHEDDLVVEKHTYDAFHETELDGWLSARGVDDLAVCGTLANVCVLHTAGSAGLRDYRPVLVEDAIGAIEDDHHEYALEHADWLFGEVEASADVTFA
jgi:nicotinamidase-related amidase